MLTTLSGGNLGKYCQVVGTYRGWPSSEELQCEGTSTSTPTAAVPPLIWTSSEQKQKDTEIPTNIEGFFLSSYEYRVTKPEFRVTKTEYRVVNPEYRVTKPEFTVY